MKMKVIISSFILILIFSTILIIASPRFVTISGLDGNVEIKSESKLFGLISVRSWKELKEDQDLNKGDIIRTDDDGVLELVFNDNIYVEVDNNSQIVIGENEIIDQERTSSIILNSGRVWAKVKKIYQELTNFEVITPTAVAGVRGTLFSVYTNGEETTLSVKEGAVDLSSIDGQNKELVTQEQMGIAAKGVVTLEKQIREEENNRWKNKNIEEWLEKAEKGMKNKKEDKDNTGPPDHANPGGKPDNPGNDSSDDQGGKPDNPEDNDSSDDQGGKPDNPEDNDSSDDQGEKPDNPEDNDSSDDQGEKPDNPEDNDSSDEQGEKPDDPENSNPSEDNEDNEEEKLPPH